MPVPARRPACSRAAGGMGMGAIEDEMRVSAAGGSSSRAHADLPEWAHQHGHFAAALPWPALRAAHAAGRPACPAPVGGFASPPAAAFAAFTRVAAALGLRGYFSTTDGSHSVNAGM